jgi:RNA ligase (TIGR02306 family)
VRQLVTKRIISDLSPIPDADLIETATIDGWKVVVKKGEFSVGWPCAFFELDSFLPAADPRFAEIDRLLAEKITAYNALTELGGNAEAVVKARTLRTEMLATLPTLLPKRTML